MSQQVNLYQPIFRKEKKIFSTQTLLQACLILVVALGLIYGYGRWQVHSLAVQLDRARVQATQMQQRVAEIQRVSPARTPDPRLIAHNRRLQTELAHKQRVMATLADRALGNTAGFAPYFAGLARQHVDGLWLTGLTVAGGGAQLELRGSTLKPELVPRYLQRLGGEGAFKGMAFRTFEMTRPDTHPQQINFLLRTADAKAFADTLPPAQGRTGGAP